MTKILNLTEEYNYQKTHHEKCYFGHMEKTYYNVRFYQKTLLYFGVFIVYFVTFPILCYLYQKGKQTLSLTTANENEKAKVQKVQLTSIVIFLISCSVILGLTYFKAEIYLPSNFDTNDLFKMPLGMDENTKCEISDLIKGSFQPKVNGT